MAKPGLLILGGTTLGAGLARLTGPRQRVIYSLAGRTKARAIADVITRSGGFGGAEALAAYLAGNDITAVVDATHAHAAEISRNCEIACRTAKVPLLRLEEPPWQPEQGDHWIAVETIAQARDVAVAKASRIFVTTGRQDMLPFASEIRCWWLARVIAPGSDLPPLVNGDYIHGRGPFEIADETALLRKHEIGAVISKNAGGAATYAKIAAARELALPVIMISRPLPGSAPNVSTTDAAINWLALTLGA
ncbi:MAG: cobalt-precorrin-6A reductase [Alphaproteobacteria bacterium]|jgi:precorrin-6A/cobalt-precorrin-6A reductase